MSQPSAVASAVLLAGLEEGNCFQQSNVNDALILNGGTHELFTQVVGGKAHLNRQAVANNSSDIRDTPNEVKSQQVLSAYHYFCHVKSPRKRGEWKEGKRNPSAHNN